MQSNDSKFKIKAFCVLLVHLKAERLHVYTLHVFPTTLATNIQAQVSWPGNVIAQTFLALVSVHLSQLLIASFLHLSYVLQSPSPCSS